MSGLMDPSKKSVAPISILIILYATLLLIWYALWLFIEDGNWWLTLLNRVVPYLFIPTPLLALRLVWLRHFKRTLVLLAPGLLFVGIYFPYLVPTSTQPIDRKTELSVMTYNVLFSNAEYDQVAKVILTYQPDLVALQEVQPQMMIALQERLATTHPYSLMGDPNPYGTTAIFSRHPIAEARVLDLEADRPAVMMRTQVNAREITFVSAHLLAYGLEWVSIENMPTLVERRTAEQNRQAEILVRRINEMEGIAILACDCNSPETSSSYRRLTQSMKNAARQAGWSLWGNGLTNTKPDRDLQHIDYVLYRGAVEPIRVEVIDDRGGSDHLPLLAKFGFANALGE